MRRSDNGISPGMAAMAGAKRNFDNGNDFGRDGDTTRKVDTDIVDNTAAQRISSQRADGPPKKRLKTHETLLHRNAGIADGWYPAAESALFASSPGTDFLSPLSDELLVRILGNLSLADLLSLAPVSRRFHRLADDSQLWKAIYYERFVLPRAMRVPGFRAGTLMSSNKASTGDTASRAGRCSEKWPGSVLQPRQCRGAGEEAPKPGHVNYTMQETYVSTLDHGAAAARQTGPETDWKQQYRLRHNWARGKCAVEELRLGAGSQASSNASRDRHRVDVEDEEEEKDEISDGNFHRMLVKVVDGIAVTADRRRGLRIWELKSRSLAAAGTFTGRGTLNDSNGKPTDAVGGEWYSQEVGHSPTGEAAGEDQGDILPTTPTSLAIDLGQDVLDIAIGLHDGGFDIWQHDLRRKSLVRRFSHPASSSGPLTGIAYSHPYVLTATDTGLISLYAFGPDKKQSHRTPKHTRSSDALFLSAPQLLTSLRSHTSQPPLALSIRKLSSVIIASIAYTFSTHQGWSIGIQDMHIKEDVSNEDKATRSGKRSLPTVVATRLAHTLPVAGHARAAKFAGARRSGSNYPSRTSLPASLSGATSFSNSATTGVQTPRQDSSQNVHTDDGPTSLCYTHPYLLATMPDNTLILHLCTSNALTLAISPGIRLWGHTSGISDAEITARGKAVSVSMRGEEMRVWELEGRPAAERGQSVAIRPNVGEGSAGADSLPADYWDERRNWVGFDDEMVIVLKETRGGRESLMVYDFT